MAFFMISLFWFGTDSPLYCRVTTLRYWYLYFDVIKIISERCLKVILPKCRIYASVNWVTIGSDNGLSPVRRQAISWTSTHLLSIWTLGWNFSEICFKIPDSSIMKMHLKMSSAKWWPFCSGGYQLSGQTLGNIHTLGFAQLCVWSHDQLIAVSRDLYNNIHHCHCAIVWLPVYWKRYRQGGPHVGPMNLAIRGPVRNNKTQQSSNRAQYPWDVLVWQMMHP